MTEDRLAKLFKYNRRTHIETLCRKFMWACNEEYDALEPNRKEALLDRFEQALRGYFIVPFEDD